MNLLNPVTEVKGIGEKTAAILNKAGIKTTRDLIYYFPRTYENFQNAHTIDSLKPGKVILKAKVKNVTSKPTRRRNFTITTADLYDHTGTVKAVWFNQPYRAHSFATGEEYYFTGEFSFKYGRYQLTSPAVTKAKDVEQDTNKLQPIYPVKSTITSNYFKKVFANLKPEIANTPDLLPLSESAPAFLTPNARAEALLNIHFPETEQDVETAREYLSYEELFAFILAAKLNKQESQKIPSIPLSFSAEKTKLLVQSLPFTLTNAQRRATWEILQDLEKPVPMNRLLQGDVGSGKTIVAGLAAHQAATNHAQSALLAPTAILATQHYTTLSRLLEPLGVKVTLLTGATKKKASLKNQIKNGEIDFVIGTHALLTDDTEFKNLALCIIDEQHRFGVEQRQKLVLKSPERTAPHLLSMTATPIPRSLQLTIFGDLSISILNELPAGRQPITTHIISELNLREDLYPVIKQKLKEKDQIYWICKAIDDNPTTETKSVKKQTEKLRTIFKTAKIEYLHGRMKPAEKDQIMSDFESGKIDILVSTTVVEVGVDVPNATVIVIEDAENYGLAQLHQLRGRVGRGHKTSACYLVIEGENPPTRRLKELQASTDGFHLAEIDLKLRGPGEIYGNLQHGALDLRIATLSDAHLITLASRQAEAFAKNPENMLKYKELSSIISKYQQLTTLN